MSTGVSSLSFYSIRIRHLFFKIQNKTESISTVPPTDLGVFLFSQNKLFPKHSPCTKMSHPALRIKNPLLRQTSTPDLPLFLACKTKQKKTNLPTGAEHR